MVASDPVFFPGGVADPEGRAGYVADGDGIVAVGLRHGEPLWRTERAVEPLIADQERLAAARPREPRANVIEVVVLDATEGEPALVSDPVVLPDWVTVAPERRERFRMNARLEGHRLRLEWEAHARYGGGAPPPAHIRREAARDAAGLLEIDLESGAVSPLPLARRENGGEPTRRPPLDAGDLSEPWLAGAAAVRLVSEIDGAAQTLALETHEASSSDRGTRVELARGEGLVAEVARDGRHVFVHREPAASGQDQWLVFSVPTGRRVATLAHDAGARSPVVLRERVYYLLEEATPERALRARDLASGSLAWELPLATRLRSGPPRLRQ